MKKINTDLKYLFLLWIILILAIMPTYGHHGHLLIDCGREVYYPTQILLGKVLYKDIFNIYGPFSYMLNALLFKIFGINLNVLYLAGCVCAFIIMNLIYLISKQFLSKFFSFSISIFTIAIGILNLNLFNFIFPYSYGMLYGFTAFLVSVWFLLKYTEKPEKDLYLYLGSFLAGLCITSKYEFLPYLIVVLYAIFKVKPLNIKQYFISTFSFLFIPVFCFGILLLQGLRISDLISTFIIIKNIAHSRTLEYFYRSQGVYLRKYSILLLLYYFLLTIIPFAIFTYGFKVQKRVLSEIIILISIILMFCLINPASFVFFPILVVILGILNFKNLIKNTLLMILTLSAITISVKVFWGLATLNYGVFFASFLTVTIFALLMEIFKNKDLNQNIFGIYFLIVTIILSWQNLSGLAYKDYPVQSTRGKIYFYKDIGSSTQDLINYISKNTKKTDTIVIFPEGQFINFLTDRESDNYYNSLIPLYIETFGEKDIIEHFKKTMPEYIIFNNWNTKDYYFKYICSDYALDFCSFVASNYIQKKAIGKGFRYLIFKKR